MEEKVKEIVLRYSGDKSYLVPILQDVQKEFNYLPKEALFSVSAHLSVPISRVYEVVTFYKAFSLKPKGRIQLSLCMGTACHVRGAAKCIEATEKSLGVPAGGTSPDFEYTMEIVYCLGSCGLAPVAVVDDRVLGRLTPNSLVQQLETLR